MPGQRSLDEQKYYAHPQNAFWFIMGELFSAGPELPYRERCERLRVARVAVWDVLQSCQRQGSLDASILRDSIIPNDFSTFFQNHSRIQHVFFNGARAHEIFSRTVGPSLSDALQNRLNLHRLPSTSPAHASLNKKEKLDKWRLLLSALESPSA